MMRGRTIAPLPDAPVRGGVLVLVLVAAAVAVHLLPALGAALIFDRAAIDAGEYWRIATASLVHFSWAHLAGDAAVLVVAGWLLEERPGAEIAALLLGASAASGLAVLFFAPELRWYGGLSGVAHGAVVYVALLGTRDRGRRRALSYLTLIVIVSKLALDAGGVRVVAGSHLGAPVAVADMSHRGAIAYALVLFAAVALWTSVRAHRAARLALVSATVTLVGCLPGSTSHHGAAVAPRVLAHSATVGDSAHQRAPSGAHHVGVTFAPDDKPGRDREVFAAFGRMEPKPHPLSAAEKTEIIHRVVASLGRAPVAEVRALPPIAEGDPVASIELFRSQFGTDFLVVLGYDQVQRTYDRGLVPLLGVATASFFVAFADTASSGYGRRSTIAGSVLAGTLTAAYLLPTQRNETRTLVEAVVYHVPSGHVLARVPATRSSRGLSSVVALDRSLRSDALSDLAVVADSIAAGVARELAILATRGGPNGR